MKEDIPELDKKCVKIFSILVLKGELKFTKLKNELIEMNEATLLIHLNHLIQNRMVVKTVYSHKNVTYKPNIKKLNEFKTYIKSVERRQKQIGELRKQLFAMSVSDQLNTVVFYHIRDYLLALKHKILFLKHKRFEDRLLFEFFEHQSFRILENLMLRKCREESDYLKNVSEAIDMELKKYES